MFDDVQAFVDLTAEFLAVKVLAKENSFDRPAEFRKGLVSQMLNVVPNEAAQD